MEGWSNGKSLQVETEETEKDRRFSVISVPSCSVLAFTMIEIAISLAIIGFALVAIIGILPTGMGVQKENRQETIINQDMSTWMEAIRNGAQGMDDLTNYVFAITNFRTAYDRQTLLPSGKVQPIYYTRTPANSSFGFNLLNGYRIVGLLTTPKFTPAPSSKQIYSNYFLAYASSLSGPANEKFPQTNRDVLDLGFNYRFASEVVPHTSFHPDWTNYTFYVPNTNEYVWRSNYWRIAKTMQTNFYDVRLLFRWPLLPNGDVGNGRQIFRTMASGHLAITNEPNFLQPECTLYFFESRTYVQGGTNY